MYCSCRIQKPLGNASSKMRGLVMDLEASGGTAPKGAVLYSLVLGSSAFVRLNLGILGLFLNFWTS